MEKKNAEKRNTARVLSGLFGEPTPAKTAGFAYSFAVLFSVVLAFIFMLVVVATGNMDEEKDWYLYCSFLLPQLSFACVALVSLRYADVSIKERVKAQSCKPKYFLVALLMQIGLFSLSALNGLFIAFLEKHGYNGGEVRIPSLDGFGFFGVLFVVAVLPAVFEEILFRGILLHGLKSAFSETVAVLLCGALFSLYHQNPAQTIYQFCCGTAFAFVAVRAGSVLPTMVAHLFNNAFIIIMEKFPASWVSSLAFTIVSAVCLVGATVWLCCMKNKDVETDKKADGKTFFLFASVGISVCFLSWIGVLLG